MQLRVEGVSGTQAEIRGFWKKTPKMYHKMIYILQADMGFYQGYQ